MVEANRTINVGELSEQVDRLVAEGYATKEGNVYNVNLTEAGIDKLLGNGNLELAINVTVSAISEKARAKIVEAGGSVVE
jgi:large subunit ribosomal protein L15